MTAIERVDRDVRGSVVGILWVLAAAQGMVGTWALVAPLVFTRASRCPGIPGWRCCRRSTSISSATSAR
jgi:hypothetical protein